MRSSAFTEVYNVLKETYDTLSAFRWIRPLWKGHKNSRRAGEVASRIAHRRAVHKKKQIHKKMPSSVSGGLPHLDSVNDTAEARSMADESLLDPARLWSTGDGSVERYTPPVVRKEKVKTRKTSNAPSRKLSISPSPAEERRPPAPSPSHARCLDQLKASDLATRDILWRKVKGVVKWSSLMLFLSRLGCGISSQGGSKKKVVDEHTGRCTVLHKPHPGDECRRDQLDGYRVKLEESLLINYEDVLTSEERSGITSPKPPRRTSSKALPLAAGGRGRW